MLTNTISIFNDYTLEIANYLSLRPTEVKIGIILSIMILMLFIGWYINHYSNKKYYYPVIYKNATFIAHYAILIVIGCCLGRYFIDGKDIFTLQEWIYLFIALTIILFLTLYFKMVKNTSFIFATLTYFYVLLFLLLIIPFSIIAILLSPSDVCLDEYYIDEYGDFIWCSWCCDKEEV